MEFFGLVITLLVLGSNSIVSGQSILGSLLGLDDTKRVSMNNNNNLESDSGGLLGNSLKALSDGLADPRIMDSQIIGRRGNHGNRYPLNLLNLPNNINPLIKDKINQGNYQDKDVKLAAQKFPQLQALLDRLRELNKQKELQQHGYKPTETTTNPWSTTIDENGHESTQGPKIKPDAGKLKSLKKKKFYFQAKPVRPESEKNNEEEVVYYED